MGCSQLVQLLNLEAKLQLRKQRTGVAIFHRAIDSVNALACHVLESKLLRVWCCKRHQPSTCARIQRTFVCHKKGQAEMPGWTLQ